MPKKDTNLAIASMLSEAGANTRRLAPVEHEETVEPAQPSGAFGTDVRPHAATGAGSLHDRDPRPPATVNEEIEGSGPHFAESGAVTTRATVTATVRQSEQEKAPRTLRLRPQTAHDLRGAWVEAKRLDVFLTAQDFASDLIQEALLARRMRTTPSAS